MEKLPEHLKVLTEDEETLYTMELKKLSLVDLPSKTRAREVEEENEDPEGTRKTIQEAVTPDEWWGTLLKNNNLPSLKKVLSAALTLFTGPVIEGSFSEVSNIVTNKRNSMKADTLDALQTVKYHIHAKGMTAVDYFHRDDVDHIPVNVELLRKVQTSRTSKRKLESEAAERRISEEVFYELPEKRQKKQTLEETREVYKNILGSKKNI